MHSKTDFFQDKWDDFIKYFTDFNIEMFALTASSTSSIENIDISTNVKEKIGLSWRNENIYMPNVYLLNN